MLAHILADMNHSLQPEDKTFTLDDAIQHVNDYNAWIDSTTDPNDYPLPIDFARQVYPDLQIWEVPGYGRVWIDREGFWHHNGPKVGFLKIARERFEDAIADLIEAVHWQLDREAKGVQS